MTNPDYRIQECFDLDFMARYYVIHKYNLPLGEYRLHSPKRFPTLLEAQTAVRMLRRYKETIYHYVED